MISESDIFKTPLDGLKGITRIDLCVLEHGGTDPCVNRSTAGEFWR